MKRHASRISLLLLASVLSGCAPQEAHESPRPPVTDPFRSALLDVPQLSDVRLAELKQSGITTIVVPLAVARRTPADDALQAAAGRVRAQGLQLYYWIEIARCPELAEAHPAWMASLQGP